MLLVDFFYGRSWTYRVSSWARRPYFHYRLPLIVTCTSCSKCVHRQHIRCTISAVHHDVPALIFPIYDGCKNKYLLTYLKLVGTCHYKHFKISTHHITPTLKKLHQLASNQTKNRLHLLTYQTLTNQQPTYLYNSLSFPSLSVLTGHCGQKGFLCHWSMTLEFTPSWYPKLTLI